MAKQPKKMHFTMMPDFILTTFRALIVCLQDRICGHTSGEVNVPRPALLCGVIAKLELDVKNDRRSYRPKQTTFSYLLNLTHTQRSAARGPSCHYPMCCLSLLCKSD
jgi:hypothetical protein